MQGRGSPSPCALWLDDVAAEPRCVTEREVGVESPGEEGLPPPKLLI